MNRISTKNTLPASFYSRSTLDVARELLGVNLCRRLPDGKVLSAPIVEVEAYTGDDPACHAYRGLTPRSSTLFGPPGCAYVYFIYGMYNCFNVVTEPVGTPGAVLVRAIESENTNGPGKLCRQWNITREHNGLSLLKHTGELWLSPGGDVKDEDVGISPRIGVSSAQDRLYRFFIKGHPSVSGPRKLNNG
jgi:DNA-3-methyladenine glycosylase